MNRINLIPLLLGVFALLTLSACQTGGGYSSGAWDFSRTQNAPAQSRPKKLAGGHIEAQTLAQAQAASESSEVQGPLQPLPHQRLKEPDLPRVKVALLLPLTGQHEALGQSMLRAAQLALFDVGHANFELLPRDTKGTAEGAREAARSALAEGAELILGPVFAGSVRAVKPVARSANVNVIAFSTDWGLAGDNTFIMGFLPFDQVERLAAYVSQKNLARIGIIAPRSDYGRVVTSAWQSITAQTGVPPAAVTTFSPGSSNLAPVMRKFTQYDDRTVQANAQGIEPIELEPPFDAVLMPVGGEMALSISNLLSHYDLPPNTVRRLGTGLFDDAGLATETSLKGAWFAAPSPRLRRSFEHRYRSMYSASAPRLATLAYDAAALAAILAQRGLKASGRPDFSAGAIGNPNGFSGIDGIFRFRPNGTAERGLAILEFRRSTIRIIDDAPTTFQNMRY